MSGSPAALYILYKSSVEIKSNDQVAIRDVKALLGDRGGELGKISYLVALNKALILPSSLTPPFEISSE